MNNIFLDKNLVIILLLGHLVGDFIFQSNSVYQFKKIGLRGILWHTLIVSLSTLVVLTIFCGNLYFIISSFFIAFGFHFVIDLIKYKSSIEESIKFILGQICHLFSLIIISILLKSIIDFEIRNAFLMKQAMYLVGMTMIIYFLKYFIISLYKILDITEQSSKFYRFLESAERYLIFYFSYMHGFYFLMISLAVLPRSIYAINNNKQHIFYDVILSMIISSSSGIILRKATIENPFGSIEFLLYSVVFFILAFVADKFIDIITRQIQKISYGS
ncbi:MAG: hypothetical protein COX48_02830 [bacterium (Candidatus Stahlbacteria) CG23_combo_of_CG06-09_8_20_14_all_34_7]|nr:MAG: hypothetical protein COX48_02830 [bacterium (Candidatus Stahlbacteria) CG23_combo_of_CG06-09_8_20_14_all_34_7]